MTRKSKQLKRHNKLIAGIAIAAITSGALGVVTFAPVMAKTDPAHSSVLPLERAGFADLIEAVSPAVVAISTSGNARSQQLDMPDFHLPPGSPFEDFFERFFKDRGLNGQGAAPSRKFKAQGSGFIIDAKGVVVTNYHVVKGAEEITVITRDGNEYDARIKGHDPKTDLAVLEVDSDDPLPYVVFGDSDKARVGDWVLAIGNPFGLGGSATTGIISARGRDINAGPLDDFLQVDAPINRGNSGGPLFSTSGEVIGVNTAIFSPNGGNVGIGFAIPSSMASSVVNQLMDNGHVQRGWLGVQIQGLTAELAESLDLSEDKGALVASVVEDSPAQKAGIRIGDVIMKFNGNSIDEMRDLPRIVADTPGNSEVVVNVWRDGKIHSLQVTVGESGNDEQVELGSNDDTPKGELGLALAELNDKTRAQFRVADSTEGVLVVRVEPDSAAADKGIQAGDIIKMVGNSEVSSPDQVVAGVKAAAKKERKSVLLLVERNGADRFVAVGIV
jgi:serine protease Do